MYTLSPVRQEDAEELRNHVFAVETPRRRGEPFPEDEATPTVKRKIQHQTTADGWYGRIQPAAATTTKAIAIKTKTPSINLQN